MTLKVVGWVYYNKDFEQGRLGWAARHAIIDDIKEHGYLFSGWAHQEGYGCAPILNDGKIYCYSQRSWGSIMAEAHGYTGRMDYAKFAFMMEPDTEKRPSEKFDEDGFVPETDLNEKFEIKVERDAFDIAQSTKEIKFYDVPSLRYLDEGDTVVLVCGEDTAEYTVADVDRQRDLSKERLTELEFEFRLV